MDVNDRHENGPEDERPEEQEPTADEPTAEQPPAEQPPGEGPQAPAGAAAGSGAGTGAGAGPGPGPGPQKRLVRTRDDRVIGGVAGGLGRYFNVDPIFFRIGAIALTFVGGAGLLLYLAALLLVPGEDGAAAAVPGTQGRNRGLVIAGVVVLLIVMWPFLLGGGFLLAGIGIPLAILVGAGVLVWWVVSGEGPSGDARDIARRAALGVGVLILCSLIAVVGAFVAAAGPDWIVPALVILAGAGIVAGAFLKPVRWLVLPAITLALAAGTVAAAGIDLDGGVGDRDYRPASTEDLRDRYELGMGELVVDLRDTDLPAGDVPLELDLGIGEARLIVPDDVCVATAAEVGLGNVHVFGRDNGWIDVDFDERPNADADTTRLLLDAHVGVGEVRVHDEDDELYFRDDNHRFGPFDEGNERDLELDLDGGGNTACASTGETAGG
jgi:phage shock protein PspC (stress-responsive transcriptional regulator)